MRLTLALGPFTLLDVEVLPFLSALLGVADEGDLGPAHPFGFAPVGDDYLDLETDLQAEA